MILWNALRLRCVICGVGRVMTGWLTPAERCAHCGFRFERAEQGYQVGSYAVNVCLTLAAITASVVVAVALTWPDTNWSLITAVVIALAATMPIAIFPWSKSLYMALDAVLRPPGPEDFDRPAS